MATSNHYVAGKSPLNADPTLRAYLEREFHAIERAIRTAREFPLTDAESDAGAELADPFVPSHEVLGYVDPHRYGDNTEPGTTIFSPTILRAIDVAERVADADGRNMPVRLRGERYAIDEQLVIPHGVSLLGAGDRSTVLEPQSVFTGITTTGAVRIGRGTGPVFGSVVADLMLQMAGLAGSIACYSSDIQAGGFSRVTVNNFAAYGFVFDGAGGTFGSVNGFALEHCQAFKVNAGGTSGVAFKFKDGTFPPNIHVCQVYGNPSNPLAIGYEVENFPFVAQSINVDGAGTVGVSLGANVPIALILGMTSLGWGTSVDITMSGRAALKAIYRSGGTVTVEDAGNGGTPATITTTPLGSYER